MVRQPVDRTEPGAGSAAAALTDMILPYSQASSRFWAGASDSEGEEEDEVTSEEESDEGSSSSSSSGSSSDSDSDASSSDSDSDSDDSDAPRKGASRWVQASRKRLLPSRCSSSACVSEQKCATAVAVRANKLQL